MHSPPPTQAQAAVQQSNTSSLALSKQAVDEIKRGVAFNQSTADHTADIKKKLADMQLSIDGIKAEMSAVKQAVTTSAEAAKQVRKGRL